MNFTSAASGETFKRGSGLFSAVDLIRVSVLLHSGSHLPLQVPDAGHAGVCGHDGHLLHHQSGVRTDRGIVIVSPCRISWPFLKSSLLPKDARFCLGFFQNLRCDFEVFFFF